MNLKPCPFCGGEAAMGTVRYSEKVAREQHLGQEIFYKVNCVICSATNLGFVGHKTEEGAAAHWNQRTGDQSGA